MKNKPYIIAALLTATAAMTITRANINRRASLYYFKLLPGLSPTSQHVITTTTNWTLTLIPSCTIGSTGACVIGSNTAPTTTGSPTFRHMPTIPVTYTIPAQLGGRPGYYSNYPDVDANITEAISRNIP